VSPIRKLLDCPDCADRVKLEHVDPDPTVILIPDLANAAILRFDAATGRPVPTPWLTGAFFTAPGSGGMILPTTLDLGPDGNLYVANRLDQAGHALTQILRFDGTTGDFLGEFTPAGSGGLGQTKDLHFGPDGNLYVSSPATHSVLRYDGTTGAFLGVFASAGLGQPQGFAFGPDGSLYVANNSFQSGSPASILRYDGQTGDFRGVFVTPGSGNLFVADDIAFGPDSNLYVSNQLGQQGDVLRFDGATGAFLGVYVPPGQAGLQVPAGLAFLDTGNAPSGLGHPHAPGAGRRLVAQAVRSLPAATAVFLVAGSVQAPAAAVDQHLAQRTFVFIDSGRHEPAGFIAVGSAARAGALELHVRDILFTASQDGSLGDNLQGWLSP
jgi:hypothetical protein